MDIIMADSNEIEAYIAERLAGISLEDEVAHGCMNSKEDLSSPSSHRKKATPWEDARPPSLADRCRICTIEPVSLTKPGHSFVGHH